VAIDRLAALDNQAEDPNLWNDAEKAQKVMRERNDLQMRMKAVTDLENQLNDNIGLIEMGEAENEPSIVADAEAAITALAKDAEQAELQTLLAGEVDANDAFIEINAGAGGTEAQDWADMLFRMYLRWCDQNNYKAQIQSILEGEGAGIKSATVMVKGHNAFGWLKVEGGVHRLVRISPFDSNAKRHTSFASIAVSPVIDDSIEIDIQEKDLKIDTYRASGAGGQHVNTTDSAVRITHLPTGTVVACQSERSQHQNRDQAMKMLKAKMFELERQKREATKAAAQGLKTEIGWGHQIRSYVLHPYQMVKDLRTGVETSQTQDVLNGDLNMFISAMLRHQMMAPSDN
jgi:peptide chain release factor 2